MKKLLFIFGCLLALCLNAGAGNVVTVALDGSVGSAVVSGFVGLNGTSQNGSSLALNDVNDSAYDTYSATTTGTIRYLHLFTPSDMTAFDFNIGVYSSDGATLLVDGSLGPFVDNGGGWYTKQLDNDYQITQGVSYRLAIGTPDNTYQNFYYRSGADSYKVVQAGTVSSTMPSTMTGGTLENYYDWIIYCDNYPGIQ